VVKYVPAYRPACCLVSDDPVVVDTILFCEKVTYIRTHIFNSLLLMVPVPNWFNHVTTSKYMFNIIHLSLYLPSWRLLALCTRNFCVLTLPPHLYSLSGFVIYFSYGSFYFENLTKSVWMSGTCVNAVSVLISPPPTPTQLIFEQPFSELRCCENSATNYMGQNPSWEANSRSASQGILAFYGTQRLLCSQEPATFPYTEPHESSGLYRGLVLRDGGWAWG
jgi:hypothetical protein